MLPNFLCIGAQKSGTTTLLNQLGRHPDIYMSPARETQFFLMDNLYSQGKVRYETAFFQTWDGQKAVGEKTPEYIYDPAVPGRIVETLGAQVRLIATFRSPAQRAYSHYRHNFQQFWEDLGFEAALAAEQGRCAAGRFQKLRYSYLDRGRYATQVARYLDAFPRQNLMFLVYEQEIVQQQMETLKSIFGFLDVDTSWSPSGAVSAGRPSFTVPRFIQTDESIEIDGLKHLAKPGDLLLSRQSMKPTLIRNPSDDLTAFARRVIVALPEAPALTRAEELALNRSHFADDIHRLEDLIDADLGLWLD
ncbi:MAG TPA: sulfotransferase [Gammaproteobacteria bacterium]|nr:sulfotransferase [Gammaproteobacteria bacterium]